ncbi:MAG: AMP-binding protein [Desulfobacteraceae bacterium]|nr:AMP-binding protein [Desulfobacteraceae bacterium]
MQIQSIYKRFEDVFKSFGDKKAISFFRNGKLETQLTYTKFYNDINRVANFLSRYALKKGDRVILMLEKSVVNAVAYFALLKTGVIVVPINPGFKKDELEYLLNDAKAELILVDSKKKELINKIDSKIKYLDISTQIPYEKIDFFRSEPNKSKTTAVSKADPALIVYTSGTTGNPKGAVLTHNNLICDAKNIISVWNISHTDVLCHALPLFHIHGLCFAMHTALLSGAHVIMVDSFSPQTVLERLLSKASSDKCTLFMAVPVMYTKLMDFMGDHRQYDFSHIRLLTSGSAPLLESQFERIKKIFKKEPVEREGMTETGMNFSNPLNGKKKPGSIGRALPGVKVRIVNHKKGQDVKTGAVGEFWLQSPSIIKEYWQKPIETKAAFNDGWFRTGDLGRIDDEGYYYLTDRIKHLIISGGENISAKEVETVINNIKGVTESSVVGLADETWGEKVVALVQKDPEFELKESQIKRLCKEKLHDWKCPKKIIFTKNIPKNTMGKILKEKVKQLFI